MNIPMSWLKSLVELDCDISTFVERITMSGSKVEEVTSLGKDITNVVTGKILKIEKHPDADKLVVTQIDIGNGQSVQVVTGAENVFEGAIVPVALHGAKLANDLKITKGKIRGQVSEGMMCSVEELGFTRHDYPEAPEHGIYIFSQDTTIGANPIELLEMADDVVEFEITSNRSDCFSIIGIARETAATFGMPLKRTEIELKEEIKEDINQIISVEIKNPELCPRYIARAVKDVKIEPSPQWLRHRLTASGVRPINNIVDITNYVMLELGQPMHAFDVNTIQGRKIIVRNADVGEKFTTLDGVERTLDESMLVIADGERSVAVAGVMGGENSMITENANTVLFESANFNGVNVRLTAKKLGLRTDASSKFEKGLDPNLAEIAVNRAVQLVEQLGCGKVVEGMVDCYPNKREPWRVEYSANNINALLGTDLTAEEIEEYLNRLEIKTEDGYAVIPTFRPDLLLEADIAEEAARLYGYNNIKTTLAAGTPTVGKRKREQNIIDIIKDKCAALGISEAFMYSFESPKVFDKLSIPKDSSLRKAITITNPLGDDFSIMRTTTLNGMLQSLSINYNRRNEEAYLFETGNIYIAQNLPLTELPKEQLCLTIGAYGSKMDFYALKGIVCNILQTFNLNSDFLPESSMQHMHPGRTAVIKTDGDDIGYIGEVHPQILENYDIGAKAYIGVINLDMLMEKAVLDKEYKTLPKYPSIQRDIAMLVEDSVSAGDIEKAIREKGGKYLEDVMLFDVYKGKQIKEGCKSVAYSLSFRAADRTLTEEDVTPPMKKILENLESKLSAQLRG